MPIYKLQGKKDGKQKYRVFVNYTDSQGKYHKKSKIVYGSDEAKEAERQLSFNISETVPDSKMTVQQLYEEYMNTKKHEVRETSYEKSKGILKNHILPTFNNIRLNSLNTKLLQDWKNKINSDSKNYTTGSKKGFYKEFHALLNYAVKMEYLTKNPLNAIGSFKDIYFEKPQDTLHYYTYEQFKKYIAAAKEKSTDIKSYGFYVFFNIAFYTGMRKGEINALKWKDIEDDTIHIRRSVSQKVKGKTISETPPKNKSSYRDLQMPSQLVNILNQYKSMQMQICGYSEDWRVCGGIKCLCDTAIENANRLFSTLSGLPHIRIHDFRHTHAALLINEGVNISEIARRLGHSDIKMTLNTYGHLYPREEERAIKILDNLK